MSFSAWDWGSRVIGTNYGLVILLLASLFIPVRCVINAWLKDSEIESPVALGLLLATVIGTGLLWQLQSVAVMVIWHLLLVTGALAYPYYMKKLEKQSQLEMQANDMEKFQQALRFDPRNAGAQAGLAELHLRSGRLDAAIAGFETAIAISPRSPHVDKWRRRIRDAREQLTTDTPRSEHGRKE